MNILYRIIYNRDKLGGVLECLRNLKNGEIWAKTGNGGSKPEILLIQHGPLLMANRNFRFFFSRCNRCQNLVISSTGSEHKSAPVGFLSELVGCNRDESDFRRIWQFSHRVRVRQ